MAGGVKITVDVSGLRRLAEEVARSRVRVQAAIARGLNAGGDKVRTEVRHALQTQTGALRYSSITSRTRTARAFAGQVNMATSVKGSGVGEGMVYRIIASGYPPMKPDEFKTKVIRGPGGGVDVKFWGVDHLFARSFQQKNKGGLRMRLGASRWPVRSFDGPNMARELVKGESLRTFQTATAKFVLPLIMREIARVL